MQEGDYYETWKLVGQSHGHKKIIVHVDKAGQPVEGTYRTGRPGVVQCFTVDRIPFTMKIRRLVELYTPEARVVPRGF